MNATNQFNGIVAEGFNWNAEQKLEQSFLNNFTILKSSFILLSDKEFTKLLHWLHLLNKRQIQPNKNPNQKLSNIFPLKF